MEAELDFSKVCGKSYAVIQTKFNWGEEGREKCGGKRKFGETIKAINTL